MHTGLTTLSDKFPAAPEYLMQIYLIKRDYGYVNNARLADRIKVSRPAVSQAVGRLKKLNLAEQDKYGVISLTEEGGTLAKTVLRRHYLIEHLLVNVLEFPWAKADHEAHNLQDKISDDLMDHLYERLGRPQTCPHGNPFPDAEEHAALLNAPKIPEMEPGTLIRVLRVTEEGEEIEGMLDFCQKHNLRPGVEFKAEAVTEEGVIAASVKDGEEVFIIPIKYAGQICCEKIQGSY